MLAERSENSIKGQSGVAFAGIWPFWTHATAPCFVFLVAHRSHLHGSRVVNGSLLAPMEDRETLTLSKTLNLLPHIGMTLNGCPAIKKLLYLICTYTRSTPLPSLTLLHSLRKPHCRLSQVQFQHGVRYAAR